MGRRHNSVTRNGHTKQWRDCYRGRFNSKEEQFLDKAWKICEEEESAFTASDFGISRAAFRKRISRINSKEKVIFRTDVGHYVLAGSRAGIVTDNVGVGATIRNREDLVLAIEKLKTSYRGLHNLAWTFYVPELFEKVGVLAINSGSEKHLSRRQLKFGRFYDVTCWRTGTVRLIISCTDIPYVYLADLFFDMEEIRDRLMQAYRVYIPTSARWHPERLEINGDNGVAGSISAFPYAVMWRDVANVMNRIYLKRDEVDRIEKVVHNSKTFKELQKEELQEQLAEDAHNETELKTNWQSAKSYDSNQISDDWK